MPPGRAGKNFYNPVVLRVASLGIIGRLAN